ncbi:hypothetical protein [Actinospica sp.]|uniref:hypothetical protein n=1 Tax=Actinospica sp. TaxID=1872142 RepID=UPI002C2670B9|nr:hypothetical protein [Actinospica sp.]HWG24800.1 hypothetical protein [Actinospica sp.]
MAVREAPEHGFELELALHGPDPREALPGLFEQLGEAGADRVVEERVPKPEPGKRDAGILDVVTIAVGGVANIVAIVDTVYHWLALHRTRSGEEHRVPAEEEPEIPSVTITSGDRTIVLTYPADWIQSQAVDEFLRAHGQERDDR